MTLSMPTKADFSLSWKFALRELRGGINGFRLFLACLALGVAVIATIGSLRSAIETGLTNEGAALLGGDAEATFTYRFANTTEREWLEQHSSQVSEVVEFRSMAAVADERTLTQVKAVDTLYPLYGTVKLSPDIPLQQAFDGDGSIPGGVMERVLSDRLGLTIGDKFTLGSQQFVLSGVLDWEPDSTGSGFSSGPRTLVRTSDLAQSGLLREGTLFSTKYRLSLPQDTDLDTMSNIAKTHFADAGLRWRDSRNGAPRIARFIDRVGSFLVLVGISGLAVGGIGVSTAVRAYLAKKTTTIATLRTLGAERRVIFLTYFLQIGILSLIGICIGLLIGVVAPLVLAPALSSQLPFPAALSIYPSALIEAALYGAITALLFTLWPLAAAERIRAATLYRDANTDTFRWPAPGYLIAIAALLIALVITTVSFSSQIALTLWTLAGLSVTMLILIFSAKAVSYSATLGNSIARGHPPLRWAFAAISSGRDGAGTAVLALGLGLTVIAAIGQVDGNMRRAITGNLPDIAPSYFFVDIQRDQMPAFLDRVENDPNITKVDYAPMLRGVISKINGRSAVDVAGNHWVIRGDRGITYSTKQPDTTTITQGEWWPENYTGPPQISFAAEEAAELGLKLGDELTVNILGRDISATITSFRDVDFSNVGLDFILTMNENALSAAPHSYIATIHAAPKAEAAILRDLTQVMPNITAIRVRDALNRVATVLQKIARTTAYGAMATLLTGFLVLLGTSAAAEPARRYEAALLKTLGATRHQILLSFTLRAIFTGATAGCVALAAAICGAWAINHFVFETSYTVIWPNALVVVCSGIAVTLVSSLAFAWRPLSAQPTHTLRSRE